MKLSWSPARNPPLIETEALVRRGAAVVLGAWHSAVTMTASEAADRLATPFLNAESLGDEITERGLRHVFRLVPSNRTYARSTWEFLDDVASRAGERLSTAGILFEDSWFGRSRAAALRQEAEARGIRVTAYVDYPKPRAALGELVQNFAGSVFGTIIHRDDFKIRIVDGSQRGKSGGEFFLLVARGKNEGNTRTIGIGACRKIFQPGQTGGPVGHF